MSLEQDIVSNCNSRSYSRGRTIAASDRNILTKQVRYDAEETLVSAFVASSSGWDDRYRTSVSIDEEAGKITDYACTCPAFREYSGMCKHCVALALTFNENPQTFMGYQKRRMASSSACISELIHRAEAAVADETPIGSVKLLPELSYGYGLWSVSFRIVGTQETSYVVKSIGELVQRVSSSESFTYGKKLSFTHALTAFDETSREILQFLERACAMRHTADDTAVWYSRRIPTQGRTMQLSDAEAVELMGLLDGLTFPISGADYATPSVQRVQIRHEDPGISLELVKSDKGGWNIERGERVRIAEQAGRMFIWLGGDVLYRCSDDFARCADFLRNVYDSDDRTLFVADADMPLFCAAILPTIEKALQVIAPPEINAYRKVPCKLRFYFDKDKKHVLGRAEAVYGEKVFSLRGNLPIDLIDETSTSDDLGPKSTTGTSPAPLRDTRLEGKAGTLFDRYFGEGSTELPLSGEDTVAQLIFTGLGEFRTLGEVFTTSAFDRLIHDGKPRLTMGVSLAGNLINLTVQADDLSAEDLAGILARYRRKKRYHRLRSGAFVDLADFDLAQLDRLANDLGFRAKDLESGLIELPTYRAFYLDEEENLNRDRSFDDYIDNFKAVDEADYDVPTELASTLRPYQADGVRWLSARCDAGFGGVLADEMGLGKSVQLIALLLARRAEALAYGPSLIVCPSSLVYNWLAEFERFAPNLRVEAIAGGATERKLQRGRIFNDWNEWLAVHASEESKEDTAEKIASEASSDASKASEISVKNGTRLCESDLVNVVITSYDLARIDVADWTGRNLFICALDEAQYIKNPATLTTRAVKRLTAQHRFALTGTPMENRLSELWSIFDFLMPGLLGPYNRFRERFELPIVGGEDDIAKRLQALVGPFMLRRCKSEVLTDLPDKLEGVVYAPMAGQQQRLYAAHEQHLREELTRQREERKLRETKRAQGEEVSTVEVLAELTRLRQLCCDPRLVFENYRGHGAKLDTIEELIASAMDAGEKTLVFSQFTSFLELIAQRLEEKEVRFYTITGSTPKKERLNLVNAFNTDDVPVFLVSLKAGGTGLNLTGASVVIHADPWWNAAAQQQATDRAHRIGQTRVVSVQKVIAKGTIEERIVRLQEEKSKLADQVIGASGVSLASLSTEDLIELLDN